MNASVERRNARRISRRESQPEMDDASLERQVAAEISHSESSTGNHDFSEVQKINELQCLRENLKAARQNFWLSAFPVSLGSVVGGAIGLGAVVVGAIGLGGAGLEGALGTLGVPIAAGIGSLVGSIPGAILAKKNINKAEETKLKMRSVLKALQELRLTNKLENFAVLDADRIPTGQR